MKRITIVVTDGNDLPEGYNFKAILSDEMFDHFKKSFFQHLPREAVDSMFLYRDEEKNVFYMNLPDHHIKVLKVAILHYVSEEASVSKGFHYKNV